MEIDELVNFQGLKQEVLSGFSLKPGTGVPPSSKFQRTIDLLFSK